MSVSEDLDLLGTVLMDRSGRIEGDYILFDCPSHSAEQCTARWHKGKRRWHCDTATIPASDDELRAKLLASPPELLLKPELMKIIEEAVVESYAGDPTAPLLCYIAMTSRMLAKPLNVAIIAAASSGKSKAVSTALELMPEYAYYKVMAASPTSLIHDDEADFQNRTVIYWEADSIPSEGPMAAAIRSLAEGNGLEYDVSVQDKGGRWQTEKLQKPGPTGLVTTSTRKLERQMDSRMLTMTIADSPDHTRAIMQRIAAEAAGKVEKPNHDDLIAAQTWLQLSGQHEVIIPFAEDLTNLISANETRMRRDISKLFTVIKAVALLHQCQRERDSLGKIIATYADYEESRRLLKEAFGASASGVTREMRETVDAVTRLFDESGSPVTGIELARELALRPSSIHYRLQPCLNFHYIYNDSLPHKPMTLSPGEPLPEDDFMLPTVEELEKRIREDDSVDSLPDPMRKTNSSSYGPYSRFMNLLEANKLPKTYCQEDEKDLGKSGQLAEITSF